MTFRWKAFTPLQVTSGLRAPAFFCEVQGHGILADRKQLLSSASCVIGTSPEATLFSDSPSARAERFTNVSDTGSISRCRLGLGGDQVQSQGSLGENNELGCENGSHFQGCANPLPST